MKKLSRLLLIAVLSPFIVLSPAEAASPQDQTALSEFLEKVYQTMDDHYYVPVSRKLYEAFCREYTAARLIEINDRVKKTDNFVHLGAGLLVNKLKAPSDPYTNFIPPDKTKAFKQKAYAVTEDLGLELRKVEKGLEVIKVQKHSDAFAAGIRAGDLVMSIDGTPTGSMTIEDGMKRLTPELGTLVRLEILFIRTGSTRIIELTSRSYFKETVSVLPTGLEHALAVRISHFNQKTGDDFEEVLRENPSDPASVLILDLRNNEGGPPLAAREILGFFTPHNDPLFAIARRKQRPVMLASPLKGAAFKGAVWVLVNKGTGSASETLSAVLQAKQIAKVVGQKTAGAVYLKNIYDFEDGSAVFMLTSLTYYHDRRVFPADGVHPDWVLPEDRDAFEAVIGAIKEERLKLHAN